MMIVTFKSLEFHFILSDEMFERVRVHTENWIFGAEKNIVVEEKKRKFNKNDETMEI